MTSDQASDFPGGATGGGGGSPAARRLPEGREDFLREVMRRLDLLDREIRALSRAVPAEGATGAGPDLRQAEMLLRLRIQAARELDGARWPAARREIVEMWGRFRAEFERQALRARGSHPAPGSGGEGEGPSR